MLEELPHKSNNSPRKLRNEEIILLYRMVIESNHDKSVVVNVENCLVLDMNDGAMGSIKFISENEMKFGSTVITANYIDADGIVVIISVNIDKNGKLYELDFWKTDFSPLKKYPDHTDNLLITSP